MPAFTFSFHYEDLMKNRYHEDNMHILHILFEEQVKKTPYSTALVYENIQLTYQELNERSNQLAHYLIKTYAPKPDTMITLCIERSEIMIIAILGILKSSAAYVPIDPQYPQERIQFILQDTQTKLVITNEWYNMIEPILSEEQKDNPKNLVKNNNLAYVIYTSGTTGQPKGVMIEHQGVVNNAVFALDEIYDFTKGNKVTAFASYAFDSSVPEIFCTLLRGGELHVLSQDVRMDVFKISDYIDAQKINYLYLPPALLTLLPQKTYPSLKGIIYAGEACEFNTALFWSKSISLYNCYGPTETTVNATYKKIENGDVKFIGKPIRNVQCYVLDDTLSLQPAGMTGELYIGGIGVTRGYLNRPDLTAEKFISNPFQTLEEKSLGKNEKLYKTGDLVCKTEDGNLEYIGRIDFQVKIRGFRIELGEIESTLNTFVQDDTAIKQSVVIAKKELIAYYVSSSKLNEDQIRQYLRTKLPEHMIPAAFVYLTNIPLTVHGKIDKNTLPEPEWFNQATYVAPQNQYEKDVSKFFSELLDIPDTKIGTQDDFFKFGGNSILATKLTAKINKFYHAHLSVSDIFLSKTIESIAKKIPQKTSQWQGVICFNHSDLSKNLFMIHPGMGGCEVYGSLIDKLSPVFNCYGVDSYNFYHHDKIDDLNTLSKYYLNLIDEIMVKTKQTDYHFLGWSLGGKIALEIAAILEQKGVKNIFIYLLDTFLQGDIDVNPDEFKNHLISQNVDPDYIQQSLLLLPVADKLYQCHLCSNLKYTKILLFKASLSTGYQSADQEIFEHELTLAYNNVDKCLMHENQIEVVNIMESHANMLNSSDIIISELFKFCDLHSMQLPTTSSLDAQIQITNTNVI